MVNNYGQNIPLIQNKLIKGSRQPCQELEGHQCASGVGYLNDGKEISFHVYGAYL
jgi:hypothetical protein